MPVHRYRRQSLPAVVICFEHYDARVINRRASGFRRSRMKRLVSLVFLLVSMSCAVAGTKSLHTRVVSLDQLHNQATLIGQEVEVVSCAGIPVSDAPHQQNLIVIYPCGTEQAEDAEKTAVLGRLSAKTVLKSFDNWASGDSASFKGRFRGILKKSLIDPDDTEQVLVLELDEAEFQSAVDP